jgi:hypothetical protein
MSSWRSAPASPAPRTAAIRRATSSRVERDLPQPLRPTVGETRAKPDSRRRVLVRRSYSGASPATADVAPVGPTPVPLTVGPLAPLGPVDWVSPADWAGPVTDIWAPPHLNDFK